MLSTDLSDVLFSAPTWWPVALCFAALAGLLKLLTSLSLLEREQRQTVQPAGHPKSDAERTVEAYEVAFRQARRHHH
jgi:hypothetical protein